MAGLMSGRAPQQDQTAPAPNEGQAQGAVQTPVGNLPMEEPTPEEMKVYNQVVDNIRVLIYDEKGFDGVMQAVQSAPTPVIGIVEIVANAAAAAFVSAKQANVPVTSDMMVQAIAETTDEAVDTIERIGNTDISEDEATNAFLEAVASYGRILEERGLLDASGANQQLQQIMAQSEQGGAGAITQPAPMNRQQRRAMAAQQRKGGM